jgi:hypothetical protein
LISGLSSWSPGAKALASFGEVDEDGVIREDGGGLALGGLALRALLLAAGA